MVHNPPYSRAASTLQLLSERHSRCPRIPDVGVNDRNLYLLFRIISAS
jgi:hypothetical protein